MIQQSEQNNPPPQMEIFACRTKWSLNQGLSQTEPVRAENTSFWKC